MVEIFRTNITDFWKSEKLLAVIHQVFQGYTANFDLEDCDHILRVECGEGMMRTQELVSLLELLDCEIEVLEG